MLSGGFAASIPTSASSSGKIAKTRIGPKNQKKPSPVSSTSPQAMNGNSGTISPSSHA